MAEIRAPIRDRVSSRDPRQAASPAQTIAREVRHKRRISPFWRHFLEMLAVMVVGMIAAVAVFLTIVQATWDEALVQYPVQSLLVVAAGMTVPMVAWMRLRGHGWRGCTEMAAAMVVPVIPFLCLVWFNVTNSAQCGPYCVATIGAMLGLMLYRRSDYAMVRVGAGP
jgi:uncharacterized membrane protein YhaH (DUF805 family)